MPGNLVFTVGTSFISTYYVLTFGIPPAPQGWFFLASCRTSTQKAGSRKESYDSRIPKFVGLGIAKLLLMQMSFLYAQAESCGGTVAGLCVVVEHRSLNPAPCTRYPIPRGPKGDKSYVLPQTSIE